MIIRTILLSTFCSFLALILPITHDSSTLAFAQESTIPTASSFHSSDNRSFNSSVQIKKIPFRIVLSNEPEQKMAGFLFWDPSNFKNCFKQRSLFRFLKCIKDRARKNRTLQVLVHGFTYNHTYWDPPKLRQFSYARYMAKQGYPVLALDLLGTGASSIPDGNVLNVTESISSVAQVLTAARSLANPLGRGFKRIALVGHSAGTTIAVATTGTFPGLADFLVTTGWSFSPHPIPFSPKLITTSLATPYFRFPSPVREKLFYFSPTAKQSIIQFDNRVLADQFPSGFLLEGLPLITALATGDLQGIKDLSRVNKVNIPVLVQLGRFDLIAPPLMPEVDARLYASSPDVRVEILERMGHSFNFHENRLNSWRGIDRWITQRIVR